MPNGPLSGIRVIDLTAVVLGPYATQILGDAGADVIKVEPPEGDQTRDIGPAAVPGVGAYFAGLNRNKRSVVLDLKQPWGQAALHRLVAGADVVVHNMRLRPAERLGLTWERLSAVNPALILACATGFRPGSTLADAPAFDDLIQGRSGLAALNAGPDGAPRYVPMVLADKLTGMTLAQAITAALFHRACTGEGQALHVPMLESTAAFVLVEHMWAGAVGEPARGVGYPRMLTPHRRPYATADGHICVIAATDAQYARLWQAVGRPELAADPRFATIAARSDNIDLVYATLAASLAGRTTAAWRAALDAADVPNGPVVTLAGLFDDPYLAETGFFQRIAAGTGATGGSGAAESGAAESGAAESGAAESEAAFSDADRPAALPPGMLVTTAPPVAYAATPA
ncbi:CaiB/BaiF CoA transferase family protein, partial [Acidisphaera rubrifaciens]|uniref:CaiB/BaiF CoA transferase family protein n=1 Tax=Acidisphaera rubrifaciens TaxID=50715 RepID=UPI00069A5118